MSDCAPRSQPPLARKSCHSRRSKGNPQAPFAVEEAHPKGASDRPESGETPVQQAGWLSIAHLEAAGFKTVVKEVDGTAPYQKQFHVPANLVSCHTAVVDGYTIEGHVPAREIKRLLSERPKVVGLSVPGMPIGAPGMESGNRNQAYSVLTFDKSGKATTYASYAAH